MHSQIFINVFPHNIRTFVRHSVRRFACPHSFHKQWNCCSSHQPQLAQMCGTQTNSVSSLSRCTAVHGNNSWKFSDCCRRLILKCECKKNWFWRADRRCQVPSDHICFQLQTQTTGKEHFYAMLKKLAYFYFYNNVEIDRFDCFTN